MFAGPALRAGGGDVFIADTATQKQPALMMITNTQANTRFNLLFLCQTNGLATQAEKLPELIIPFTVDPIWCFCLQDHIRPTVYSPGSKMLEYCL